MLHTLHVGIDVSKSFNVACFALSDEKIPVPKFTFDNSLGGAAELVAKMLETIKLHQVQEVRVGVEATAFYHRHLAGFIVLEPQLKPFNLTFYVINPALIKGFKKAYPARGKNDAYDAFIIAQRLRLRSGLPRPYEVEDMYEPLQRLTRYRFHVVGSLTREKNYFLNMLFLKFSNFDSTNLSSAFGATSQALIAEFSPEEVAAMPVENLAAFLVEKSRNRFNAPADLAAQIQKIARNAFRLTPGMANSVNAVLKMSMNNIHHFEKTIAEVNKVIEQDMQGMVNPLAAVPGIGPVLSAGIISEIGNIDRFSDHAKLAKFAGLTWSEHQSGEFSADETPLNRAGNSYLRYYLNQAADQVRKRVPDYEAYYAKKYAEARTHAHKRALVLTARKLVRLVHALLSSNKLYLPPHQ